MSNKDFENDDDTSDEEYVPTRDDCAQLSEEEGDGDPEEECESDDDSNKNHKKRKSKTKTKQSKRSKIQSSIEETNKTTQNVKLSEEEQKKKTDSLWADFLKDTNTKSKSTSSTVNKEVSLPKLTKSENKEQFKNSKSKILEFAGEIVDIPKINHEVTSTVSTTQTKISPPAVTIPTKKFQPRGGISSVLGQLGKKQKISTLEKSKLDWDTFKQQENITDELNSYNKGKNG